MDDYFAVFGLPRRLVVDVEELRGRFYELSRRHHPDFHQLEGEAERAGALERSALVNRSYRTLRDPLTRLAHVMGLEDGRDAGAGPRPVPRAPRDLLEEMLEVQEALEEAKAGGLDAAARERLADQRTGLARRQAANDAAIVARFADWDAVVDAGADRRPLLEWFAQALAARAYVRTVVDDLDAALDAGQEAHVAHRRD